MLLTESLIKFGLTLREANVYLACLELGKSKVQAIAKKAELPRSTTYSVLESLISKQLVFTIKDKKITEFTAEDPQKILNLSEEATKAIKNIFPDLKNLYRSAKRRPTIKFHEGLNSLKEMYNDILRIKGLKEYLAISPEASWLGMDEAWFRDYIKRRAGAKIKAKLILTESPEARQTLKNAPQELAEVKIMPQDWRGDFTSGEVILPHKVIFSEYKKELIAVEIHSRAMASAQRRIFDFIWNSLSTEK